MLNKDYAKTVLLRCLEALGGGVKTLEAGALLDMPDPSDPLFPGKYLQYNLIRKWDKLDLGLDTKAAALAAFEQAEAICFFTNRNNGTSGTSNRHKRRVSERIIFYAIRKIGNLCHTATLDELLTGCDHSGGASLQRRRTRSSIKNKWDDRNDITKQAVGYWLEFTRGSLLNKSVNFVKASRGTTVPKDAKTDRPITIEPQANMLLQKGVGSYLRRKLRTVGIDLNDQNRNRTLCADNSYATIDLSSASDRISMETVRLMLQQAGTVLDAVESLRTPNATFGNKTYLLQKCSGMGNGFTFELESLIFYALAWAAVKTANEDGYSSAVSSVSVYGDDIIVPVYASWHLKTVLAYLGMTVNKKKSYDSGPFRESCGAHFWNGTDVTPLYIKDSSFDNRGDWYHLCNGLNEMLLRQYNHRINNILREVVKRLRKTGWYLTVPAHYSVRSGLRATFDVARPNCLARSRRSHLLREGFSFNVNAEISGRYRVSTRGAYIAALARCKDQPDYTVRSYEPPVCLDGNLRVTVPSAKLLDTLHIADTDIGDTPTVKYETRAGRERVVRRVISLALWDSDYVVFWS